MTDKSGLAGIWEDLSNYLRVDTNISQVEEPIAKYPVMIRFLVTNTAQTQEDQPEIIFEEVQLKVGMPPEWHVETVKNLEGGQSFSYDHPCAYDAIMKLQWSIEGKISPTVLMQFRRKPKSITRNQQLPIKAYFEFLSQMNIHEWLEGTIRSINAPGPDTTLAEMKAKEDSLTNIVTWIRNSVQQLQDFSGLVDYKNYRDDILQHRNRVQEYLNRADREIGDLIQVLRTHRIEGFDSSRDRIILKLTTQSNQLNEATTELAKKLGIISINPVIGTVEKLTPPPPIPLLEIDLHNNHTIEEAIPLLEKFLKESYRDNVRSIRIVHGKGIGVLRNAVRLHLENHKLVKSVSPADKDHGGEGATESNLVDYNPNLL